MTEELIGEFRTVSLHVASYLLAARKLRYLRTESRDGRQAEFVFADPQQRGPEFEAAYFNGDPLASAKRLHDAVKLLSSHVKAAVRQGGAA